MLEIFINDWNRLLEEKLYLIVSMVLTILSVVAAIVLTNTIQTKENIALVVPNAQAVTEASSKFANSSYFNVSILEAAPPKSQLVQNRYDAIVTVAQDASYNVEVIKSDELKERISAALKNPDTFALNSSTQRKIGTNIIGYMMMFLLIQGLLYARLFAEDKEKHMIKRVVVSPIAFRNYLLGHAAFMVTMIFTPTFCVIVVAKIIGATVGFSLCVYAALIAVLAILSSAFALFLNSFFCVADTANMLGSSLVILSSILAGSFSSLTKEETLFDKLLHLLPQKDFINFTNALEKGMLTTNIKEQLLYVIGLSVIFFAIAVIKTRKDYIYHR
jgi:ABC-2 type transport system permease protein